MKKKEITTDSKFKTESITALVEKYTDQLIAHRKQPNPRQFLDKYSNKSKAEELKRHINIVTLLTSYGLALRKRTQRIMKNTKKIELAKRNLLNILSKTSGGA
jgi:hypothetical protein